MTNSFYLINVKLDNPNITTIKYAKGNYTSDYFASNGTIVSNNQIRVTENGTYTVYAEDSSGNKN